MSDLIKNHGVDELVPGYEKPNKLAKTLIAGMQVDTRKAFLGCWGMHRHLSGMESPLALATMVSVWVRDHGLSEPDAAACLRSMCDPESMAKHKFTSDLVTDLSNMVLMAIRRRNRERAMAELRGPEISPEERARTAEILKGVVTSFATDGVKS